MPDTIWEVLDWDVVSERAQEDTPMGRFANKVLGSTNPDEEFERGCRAYVRGPSLTEKLTAYQTRRFRVFALAEYFQVDRARLARWFRARGIIGPKD